MFFSLTAIPRFCLLNFQNLIRALTRIKDVRQKRMLSLLIRLFLINTDIQYVLRCVIRDYSWKITWAAVASVSILDSWIFKSVYLQSLEFLTVKDVEASINVSKVSYKSCTLLWNAKKGKVSTWNIHVYFHNFFFPGLPNLGAQIRCAQNWYIVVQTNLK